MKERMMSSSPTITDDLVTPSTVGEMLLEDFLEPISLSVTELARHIEVTEARLRSMLYEGHPIDAELDLRIGRYFGLSEGFLLRYQASCDLRIARMRLHDQLGRITPHPLASAAE
jgi:addiction module HigA family antidote